MFICMRKVHHTMNVFVRKLRLEDTYFDKELEKQLLSLSRPVFQDLTESSLLVAKHVGNMYCPSVYACLASSLLG